VLTEPETLDQTIHDGLAGAPRYSVQLKWKPDVLPQRQFRNEFRELEDESELGSSQVGSLIVVERTKVHALEPDLTLIGNDQAGEAVEQRRLAGAARADNRDDLTGPHRRARLVAHHRLDLGARAIGERDGVAIAEPQSTRYEITSTTSWR